MFRRLLSLALIAALTSPLLSQVTDKKEPAKDAEKLRREAVAFLRETMGDVNSMRTLENRVSFSAEMAGLMWFHDEREARSMFNSSIADFRELLLKLDQQAAMLPDEDGPRSFGIFGDASGRAKIEMKYRAAMAVRQQITSSIAEHDPDLALSFYYDTAGGINKDSFRNRFAGMDSYFEFNLLGQIAQKNAAKAAQFGIKSLDKGLQYQHVDLLRKIYEKDVDKGIEFGSALLSKAKSGKPRSDESYVMGSLLSFGVENLEASQRSGGKKSVYSQNDLRDLAEALANAILAGNEVESGMQYVALIEKYQPGRAAQIRAKSGSGNRRDPNKFTVRGNSAANAMTAPPPDYAGPVNTVGMASNSNSNRWQQEQDANRQAEERLMGDVAKIGKGELPKEEREKVIAQARKILMQTQGKDKQIMGLSMLAASVARVDKDLAAEIMRDAEGLVNPYPKNYQDFMYTWMLAAGYAESDPEKAFPILEEAIGRANDLISAFITVGEFIDVTEEMISEGEVQVGAFGGGMIRGLTKELGVAESTLATLTKADFEKTKALTNRFDRVEVRVLAKMLVLRSILGGNAAQPTANEQMKKVLNQN